MSVIQTKYPNDSRRPIAKVVGISPTRSSPTLELQVNIEGRDHNILLPLDALQDHGVTGPAAVVELRGIRLALEALGNIVPRIGR